MLPLSMSGQEMVTASGNVADTNGEPLIGCTVQQKGGTVGTVVDFDGNFKLQVPKNAVLVFSFIGYKFIIKYSTFDFNAVYITIFFLYDYRPSNSFFIFCKNFF